jgi:hypothetical protein
MAAISAVAEVQFCTTVLTCRAEIAIDVAVVAVAIP